MDIKRMQYLRDTVTLTINLKLRPDLTGVFRMRLTCPKSALGILFHYSDRNGDSK